MIFKHSQHKLNEKKNENIKKIFQKKYEKIDQKKKKEENKKNVFFVN